MMTSSGIWYEFSMPDGGLNSGGVEESFPEQGPHATCEFKCRWVDRYNFMAGLRGGVIDGFRVPPAAYPYSTNLFCTQVTRCKGLGPMPDPMTGLLGYRFAIVTAEYGIYEFDFDDGDPTEPHRDPSGKAWTTTRARLSAQIFTPPGGAYFWEDSHKAVIEALPGFVQPKTEYTITRHWMATVDQDLLDSFIGTVNDADVRIGTRTYGRGTLLFVGASIEPAGVSFGGKTWNYEYTIIGNGWASANEPDPITEKPYLVSLEWNQFLNRSGDYQYINTKTDGTGLRPYRYTNFWSKLP